MEKTACSPTKSQHRGADEMMATVEPAMQQQSRVVGHQLSTACAAKEAPIRAAIHICHLLENAIEAQTSKAQLNPDQHPQALRLPKR